MVKKILILFLTISSFVLSAQINFEATVSKSKLALNERLRIDFVMNQNGDNFSPPEFENFQIIGGPNQSIKTSYINGERKFSKTYSYFLKPLKKGKLKINQASIEIDGEIYKSLQIEVLITDSVKQPSDSITQYYNDDDIELRALISKGSPYLNEPITVVYKLYYKAPINISDARETETPNFKDFWSQTIKIPQLKVNREIYKGQNYNVVEWRKVVLYPQKVGELEISPLSLNLVLDVPTDKRDFFGNVIYDQTSQMISTGMRRIIVKDLPQQGKPNSFSGAVGNFEFDVILNKNSLRATESFQAELKVKGNGNLKLFDLPDILVPNSMELFEPEREELISTNLSGMSGSVSKFFTVIPRFQGNFPIEEVEFSYFDPNTEKYKVVKSPRLTIDVYDGPVISNTINNDNSNIITSNDSFRFIKLKGNLREVNNDVFFQSQFFYAIVTTPFILLLSFLLFTTYKRNKKESSSELIRIEERNINKMIDSAKESIGDKILFYDKIEKALIKSLIVKFSIRMDSLNKEKIQQICHEKGLSKDDVLLIIKLIENCEKARYSRSSDSIMNKDLEIAKKVISSILKVKS
ncbi:BatD family protein [Flavobacteriaceae bacterium]|nr:BatD family protein [Flavobacteriaceae bacterium]MDC1010562.1 BatD family protein [Flavobacteriaceae bacterium]MDC3219267.1 BatD family protein [Flavobacteriaceae bacterium]MDC3297585.1 BatD family protein [Flavobacteriaceae bacterium]